MRKTALLLSLTLFVGLALGFLGSQALHAQQQSQIKRTPLLEKDLADLPGKELLMYRAELPPDGASGRHSHAGHEALYVLEGTGVLEIEGQQPFAFKPGAVAHLSPKQIHNAKNTGQEPLKILVFAIHEKGHPAALPADK